jgi:hypothetical protein
MLPCKGTAKSQWPTTASWPEALMTKGLQGHAAALVGNGVHGVTCPCVARPVVIVLSSLTLGSYGVPTTGVGRRHRHRSSRSELQGKSSSILRYDAPQGRLSRAGGVFPSGFPRLVKEFIPSHLIPVIPTACGVTSIAAAYAANRDHRGWGGAVVRDLIFQPRWYEYGYMLPCA